MVGSVTHNPTSHRSQTLRLYERREDRGRPPFLGTNERPCRVHAPAEDLCLATVNLDDDINNLKSLSGKINVDAHVALGAARPLRLDAGPVLLGAHRNDRLRVRAWIL
jgi:hypothetical protein